MLATRTRATRGAATTAQARSTQSGTLFAQHERATIEKIFTENGLPGYIGWGLYGAESSYGKAAHDGGFGFGLIEPSYNGKVPRAGQTYYNAEIAAETLKGLLRSNGGLRGAVEAYSGHEYGLAHLAELGGAPSSGSNFHESHPGAGPEALGEPGLPEVSIGNPLNTIGDLISLLTSGETWIRLGEILAGAALILLGLVGLTGAHAPSVVPLPV